MSDTSVKLEYQPPAARAVEAAGAGWLGWAAFLGASWTWCIGMFLPVLLVRDFGFWGWAVFAIPNVVGAAAMGWVIKSAQSSIEVASAHRHACQIFSAVTIAFHLFFAVSVIAPLAESTMQRQGQSTDLALACFFGASALMYVYMTRSRSGDRTLAYVALLISAAAMVYTAVEVHNIARTTPERMLPLSFAFNPQALWLIPVCILGFVACPYLDLTFHRARQHSDAPRASFGVGFGVFFFTMIVFSLIYARVFWARGVTQFIAIMLFVHMTVQSTFTIAAHARELRHARADVIVAAAVLTCAGWVAYWFLPNREMVNHLHPGEVIYRLFMGFYGLVFPAYVWLVMIPSRRAGAGPSAWNLSICAAAILLAAPFFYQGFIDKYVDVLWKGVAIVLLARLATRRPLWERLSSC
jgi:hypothetical protein